MRRMLRLLNLIALLGFEAGGIVILHRLGQLEWLRIEWSDLSAWLETTAPEDALAAVIRLIALAIAYWVAGTTALYALARLLHLPAALRAVEWATVPAVRRIVDGAVALTVATASIAGPVAPAIAQTPEPVVITVDDAGRPVPPGVPDDDEDVTDDAPASDSEGRVSIVTPGLDRIGWTPQPAGVPAADTSTMSDPVDSLRDAVVAQEPGAATQDDFVQVTVVRGDHLWSISDRHLTDVLGDTPTDTEIVRYWRRVIDANRDRLRSGDPDLIYPGETVRLPPINLEDDQP